jgi:hypothetical protein
MDFSALRPFFPGYTSKRTRPTLLKQQDFKVVNGLMQTRSPNPSIIDQEIEATRERLEALQAISRDLDHDATGPYLPDYTEENVPETVVLRFFAYFKQSLTEAGDETYRVRFVRIYYFTEDDTIMIEEGKQRNSGMPQGVLLRRMRVENPAAEVFGTIWRLPDFTIGAELDLAGVVYHIYDCDDLTRRFLTVNGWEVPPGEVPPDDLYTVKRRITERPIRVTNIDTDKTHLRDFLDYDGKVLRFYTIWDDSKTMFGERRKFILHFFLVDKTIEVRQVLPPNSGRVPVSQFLKKTHLKKPGTTLFYTPADLFIGQTVDVFGRTFFIYDADGFTKSWCDEAYGPRDWTPINVDDDSAYDRLSAVPPPYNGWGDEQDSLGYCYSLHPVPPKKNIQRMLDNQGEVLRFVARFEHSTPQDVGRVFVVMFDLADDQISVFEKPRRNSGFKEGKFIQKGKIKNPATGQYFKAADIRVGELVTINGHQFRIVGADEFALSRMEAESDQFPQSDLNGIVKWLKRDGMKLAALRKKFEALDPDGTGFVPQDAAKIRIIRVFGVPEHDALTIVRRFSESGAFDYYALQAAVA